jgi:hypothetical protein
MDDSARATALLALHAGETQPSAASISGLTIGQVRYIVSRFRRLGMDALSFEPPVETVNPVPKPDKKLKAKKTEKKKDKKAKKSKKEKTTRKVKKKEEKPKKLTSKDKKAKKEKSSKKGKKKK